MEAEHNNLTVTAGTGSVVFDANIGAASGTSRIGQLTVTQANAGVTFGGADLVTGDLGPVTEVLTTGAINIGSTSVIGGTGIVLNGDEPGTNLITIDSGAASQRYNGPVQLNTNAQLTTTAGQILFTTAGTINSDPVEAEHNNLTVTAGTGSVVFDANIGAASGTSRIGQLTVTQANAGVTFGGADLVTGDLGPVTEVLTTGAINIGSTSVIGGTGIVLNGDEPGTNLITIDSGAASQRYNGPVQLNTNAQLTTTAGQILFTTAGTINSDPVEAEHNNLTVTAGTGSVVFDANIGAASGTSRIGQLTVTQANAGVTFGGADLVTGDLGPVTEVLTTGAINIGSTSVIGGTGIVLNGDEPGTNLITIDSGAASQRYNGPVQLNTNAQLTTTAGQILFTTAGTINSDRWKPNTTT